MPRVATSTSSAWNVTKAPAALSHTSWPTTSRWQSPRYYETFRLPEVVYQVLRDGIRAELSHELDKADPEIRAAKRRLEQLRAERKRLSRGVVDGSIPGDLAREEHERIDAERSQAERILATAKAIFGNIEGDLELALTLVGRCHDVYLRGDGRVRRLSNQCFFRKLLV